MEVLPILQAVREKCLDCCLYQREEVKLCPTVCCSLWAYRFGKRPTPEMIGAVGAAEPTPEQQHYRFCREKARRTAKERFRVTGSTFKGHSKIYS